MESTAPFKNILLVVYILSFFNFSNFYQQKSVDEKKNYSPMGIYLLKVNNRNTRTRIEICSKLKIKTPER